MGEMFGKILEFLHECWPLRIVAQYERGVRFWLGKGARELKPGLYAFVPFFGKIDTLIVVPDVLRLHVQNLTTVDGVTVALEVNIEYEIFDAVWAHVKVQDYKDNLGDACRRHISKRVRAWEWTDLVEKQNELEKSCRGTMTTYVRDWGITIRDVGITTFCKTRNITLSNL
jgi:regulator of protease activity HflC (stomatin/prohibitin superfamily)